MTMTFDHGVLFLAAVVSVFLALLAGLHVAAYGVLRWAGWYAPALYAHRAAERLVVASMIVAMGGYTGSLAVV